MSDCTFFPKLYTYELKELTLRFGLDEAIEALTAYEGLIARKLGPAVHPEWYKNTYKKACIPIFVPKDIGSNDSNINKLKSIFENGFGRLIPYGFSKIFSIELEDIEIYEYSSHDPSQILDKLNDNKLDKESTVPLIVLNERTPRADFNSDYYKIKRRLLEKDIVTQVISYKDVISKEDIMKWSILSIFNQIYAKLGGLPYTLYNRMSLRDDSEVIIIGLSSARDPFNKNNIVGSSVVYDDRGHFVVSKFDITKTNGLSTKESYNIAIDRLLSNTAKELKNTNSIKRLININKKVIIVIHYRGKEVSRLEEETINKIIQEFSVADIDCEVYITRLIDGDIFIYDPTDYRKLGYPRVGNIYKILDDLYILQLTGRIETYNRPIYNINYGISKPLLLSIKYYNGNNGKSIGNIENAIIKNLIYTILGMCRLNYITVQNPITRLPVTVSFAHNIAYTLPRFKEDYVLKDWLKSRLWFL